MSEPRTIFRIDGTTAVLACPESFCLMKYQDKAGVIEWLWNSRAGVTPFCLGGDMHHVDWGEDAFAPNFVPPVGMRVFMSWKDAPASYKAETAAKWAQRIKTFEAKGFAASDEVRNGEPFGFRPDDPCVVKVDAELQAHFARLAVAVPFVQQQRAAR